MYFGVYLKLWQGAPARSLVFLFILHRLLQDSKGRSHAVGAIKTAWMAVAVFLMLSAYLFPTFAIATNA
ncbi:MAG: hypothetical protein IKK26_06480 [Clostridia bacterium]|nr:hypothetical protein [Clostridia bacterium]